MPYARNGFAKPQVQEAAMSGLILLVIIGAIVAYG